MMINVFVIFQLKIVSISKNGQIIKSKDDNAVRGGLAYKPMFTNIDLTYICVIHTTK